jgi:uncharacterized membrane protein YciS (DUF1049 family)
VFATNLLLANIGFALLSLKSTGKTQLVFSLVVTFNSIALAAFDFFQHDFGYAIGWTLCSIAFFLLSLRMHRDIRRQLR